MRVTMQSTGGSFVEVDAFEVRRVLDDIVFTTQEGRVCARLRVSEVERIDLDESDGRTRTPEEA